MKKFLSLFVGALVSMSATAQATTLYIAGPAATKINGQALNDWDLSNPLEIEAENGYFTLDCQDVTQYGFAISDMKTTEWGEWAAHRYAPSAAFTKADLGKEVQLYGPGTEDFRPLWVGDWKLVISEDLSTVTVTTSSPDPTTYHLVGSFGWGADDKYQFEPEDGVDNVYWLDITTPLTSEKVNIIRNKGWDQWWASSAAPIAIGETANEWIWQTNPTGEALNNYTGTMRLELPAAITNGCSVYVTCYPTIRQHVSGTQSGIKENIITYDAPAEYFNLQGVKITNPQKGIYIVRRGNKVTKEVIR